MVGIKTKFETNAAGLVAYSYTNKQENKKKIIPQTDRHTNSELIVILKLFMNLRKF